MLNEGARILSSSDIRNIRRYVQQKFADLPHDRHAEIIYDAMQRIVIRQLPDFDPEVKLKLTTILLREVVLGQQKPVGGEHIFAACTELELQPEERDDKLHDWAQQRLGASLEKQWFAAQINKAAEMMRSHSSTKSNLGMAGVVWHSIAQQARGESDLQASDAGYAGLDKPVDADSHLHPSLNLESSPLSTDVHLNSNASAIVDESLAEHIGTTKRRLPAYASFAAVLLVGMLAYGWISSRSEPIAPAQPPAVAVKTPTPLEAPSAKDGLPQELLYVDINKSELIAYLNTRNSLLAEESYVDTILAVAKAKNIHPLLLFAITGQEQGFVPRDNKRAKEIVNNPFNVYHSWQDYNTTLEQATTVAANTINRLSKGRPNGTDAITWINREYAEDQGWSSGVRSLLGTLQRAVKTSDEP